MVRTRSVHLLAAVFFTCPVSAYANPKAWTEPHTGMPFISLEKGCFKMGSTAASMKDVDDSLDEFRTSLWADEKPQHEVCVDAFMMGQFEVRAGDWEKVMGKAPPQGKDAAPASGMTYETAKEFAHRLSQLSGGKHLFRLPTEAEWEYACRAGQNVEKPPFRETLVEMAWYSLPRYRLEQPSPAGQRKANAWGLHDMLGNIWEWTEDAYDAKAYARHNLYNPVVKEAPDGQRVIRGGSYRSNYIEVRCANRSSYSSTDSLDQIGLRLVRTR